MVWRFLIDGFLFISNATGYVLVNEIISVLKLWLFDCWLVYVGVGAVVG